MAEQTKEAAKTAEKASEQAQTKEAAKVYTFKSSKKFLSCVGLGIQFVNGVAKTSSVETAKALAKIDGVELVEE